MRTRWNWAAAVIIGAAGGGCGSDTSTNPSSDPTSAASTVAVLPTTDAPPPTADVTAPPSPQPAPPSDAPTSAEVTTTAPASALAAWVDDQVAAGRTEATAAESVGTDARLVVAHPPGSFVDIQARIIRADGSLIAVPDELPRDRFPTLVAVGERLALLAPVDGVVALWLLGDDLNWTHGPELNVAVAAQRPMQTDALDGFVLVTSEGVVDRGDGIYVPADQQGALIAPSLDVIAMAPPPDGLFMNFTTVSDSRAFVLGRDNGARGHEPLTQPWEFDAATNTWTALPIPTWLVCTNACEWSAAHEFADVFLEAATDTGIVKQLPDGSVGLYDPDSRQWRQLEMPPFQLAGPAIAALDGGLLVVAPQRAYGVDWNLNTVGVLDIAAATWTLHTLADQPTADALLAWEARTDGNVALLRLHSMVDNALDEDPQLVYQAASDSWRTPTSDDVSLWRSLETGDVADIRTLVP